MTRLGFGAGIELPVGNLMHLLAVVTSINLNGIQYRHEKKRTARTARADEIARAVDLDMAKYFKADEAFLERLSKKQLGDVLSSQDVRADRITSMQKLPSTRPSSVPLPK